MNIFGLNISSAEVIFVMHPETKHLLTMECQDNSKEKLLVLMFTSLEAVKRFSEDYAFPVEESAFHKVKVTELSKFLYSLPNTISTPKGDKKPFDIAIDIHKINKGEEKEGMKFDALTRDPHSFEHNRVGSTTQKKEYLN